MTAMIFRLFILSSAVKVYVVFHIFLQCLKHEQQCFIRIYNNEAYSSRFRPDKTRSASFLNGLKIFLEKRVSMESIEFIVEN